MADFKSYRQVSKVDYGTSADTVSLDQINTGSFLRIADSMEKMAANHVALVDERDRLKRWYEDERARNQKWSRRYAALQGHFNRLKKIST